MRLSQMTTAQLTAKRAKINKILKERRSAFIETFKANHDRLVIIHKKAGGKTFKGTFAEFLEDMNDLRYGRSVYFTLYPHGLEETESIYADEAWCDDDGEWIDRNPVKREWMFEKDPKAAQYGAYGPLSKIGARALLRVLGEVTA